MTPNYLLHSHTVPTIISTHINPANDTTEATATILGKFQLIFIGTPEKNILIPVVLPIREVTLPYYP